MSGMLENSDAMRAAWSPPPHYGGAEVSSPSLLSGPITSARTAVGRKLVASMFLGCAAMQLSLTRDHPGISRSFSRGAD